jgi:hypothetical protein
VGWSVNTHIRLKLSNQKNSTYVPRDAVIIPPYTQHNYEAPYCILITHGIGILAYGVKSGDLYEAIAGGLVEVELRGLSIVPQEGQGTEDWWRRIYSVVAMMEVQLKGSNKEEPSSG